MNGLQFWEAAEAAANRLHKMALEAAEKREQLKAERRERRKMTNAVLPKRPRKRPEPLKDWEPPDSCTCFLGHAPCVYCESSAAIENE